MEQTYILYYIYVNCGLGYSGLRPIQIVVFARDEQFGGKLQPCSCLCWQGACFLLSFVHKMFMKVGQPEFPVQIAFEGALSSFLQSKGRMHHNS